MTDSNIYIHIAFVVFFLLVDVFVSAIYLLKALLMHFRAGSFLMQKKGLSL